MAIVEHGIVVGPDTPDKLRSFEQTTTEGVVQVEAVTNVDPEFPDRVQRTTAAGDSQVVARQGPAGLPWPVMPNPLLPGTYDYVQCTYTGADMTGVIFKAGGAGGTVVGTLTLTYTAGVLQSVERS